MVVLFFKLFLSFYFFSFHFVLMASYITCECRVCHKGFKTSALLEMHMQTRHSDSDTVEAGRLPADHPSLAHLVFTRNKPGQSSSGQMASKSRGSRGGHSAPPLRFTSSSSSSSSSFTSRSTAPPPRSSSRRGGGGGGGGGGRQPDWMRQAQDSPSDTTKITSLLAQVQIDNTGSSVRAPTNPAPVAFSFHIEPTKTSNLPFPAPTTGDRKPSSMYGSMPPPSAAVDRKPLAGPYSAVPPPASLTPATNPSANIQEVNGQLFTQKFLDRKRAENLPQQQQQQHKPLVFAPAATTSLGPMTMPMPSTPTSGGSFAPNVRGMNSTPRPSITLDSFSTSPATQIMSAPPTSFRLQSHLQFDDDLHANVTVVSAKKAAPPAVAASAPVTPITSRTPSSSSSSTASSHISHPLEIALSGGLEKISPLERQQYKMVLFF